MTSPPPAPPTRPRGHKLRTRIGLCLGSVFASILIAELALRVFGDDLKLSQPSYLQGRFRVIDRDLIMIPRRYLEESHYQTEEGADVIVTLGDSFTKGFPVRSEDSYPEVLKQLLREAGWQVDVLNVGMGNSGPDQQLRLFEKHLLPRVKPSIVVWVFYANDLYDNIRQPTYDIEDDALVPRDCSDHWLYVRQQFYDAFPGADLLREHSHLFRLLLKSFESSELVIDATTTAWSEHKIALEIQRMEHLARQHGFLTCYAVIAPQSLYLARTAPKAWNKHFASRGYSLLREAVSDAPGLVEIFFEEDANAIFATEDRDKNREGDRHFNEHGYRLLAETLAAELRTRRKNR